MDMFGCARCGAVLTAAVSRVALPAQARYSYGHELLPALMAPGTYAVDPDPSGPPWRPWHEVGAAEAAARGVYAPVGTLSFGAPGAIVIAPGDARGTVLIPERCDGYCMGLDGRDGPNLACERCGQAVATRVDDCSYWQAVWLTPDAVRRLTARDGPEEPRSVRWEALAEERRGTPPIEPPGVWSPRWEAAVGAALAHLLAASAGTAVAVPAGPLTDAFGRALDALLPPGPPTSRSDRACPSPPPPRTSPWSRCIRGRGGRGSRRTAPYEPYRLPPTCGHTWPSTTNGRTSPRRAARPGTPSATSRCRCVHGARSGPTHACSATRWHGCPPSVSHGCARSTTGWRAARRPRPPPGRPGGGEGGGARWPTGAGWESAPGEEGGTRPVAFTATHLSVRPYTAGDERFVLDLINADRLLGQPATTPAMLAEALAGRSSIDGGWWAELDPPVTEVIQDAAGEILGAVSYATRSSDGAGLLLWLHCQEDQVLAQALVTHVLDQLGPRVVHAFEFASALTLGLEGLPVRNRLATRRALEASGFTARDLWRYLHAPLPVAGAPQAAHCTVSRSDDPPGKRLEIRDSGELLAEATIGRPVAGIGVLWWISVIPAARGRGLGPSLLGSALDLLAGMGADQVILYVDDDDQSGGERDRTAANRMYDRAGLKEIDRLFSFTRRR